jgi:serine/threonine protein kinase
MKRYAGNWAGDEDDYEPNEEDYISEGFIWYVMKSLANACLLLQRGTLSDNAVNAWKPITHLDLQPANVLLDTTAPMNNAAYGGYFGASAHGAHTNDSNEPPYVPILADFGISFFTPGDLGSAPSDNPEKFLTAFDTRYPPVSLSYLIGFAY